MAKAMTKSQMLSNLADQTGLSKKDVANVVDTLVQMAYQHAKEGFTIPGLGKLVLQKRKARMGRNPATGEAIRIPAKTVLKFRIAKAAKDAVAGGAPKKAAKKKTARKSAKKTTARKAAKKKTAKKTKTAAKKKTTKKKTAKKAKKAPKKTAKKAPKKTAKKKTAKKTKKSGKRR